MHDLRDLMYKKGPNVVYSMVYHKLVYYSMVEYTSSGAGLIFSSAVSAFWSPVSSIWSGGCRPVPSDKHTGTLPNIQSQRPGLRDS